MFAGPMFDNECRSKTILNSDLLKTTEPMQNTVAMLIVLKTTSTKFCNTKMTYPRNSAKIVLKTSKTKRRCSCKHIPG